MLILFLSLWETGITGTDYLHAEASDLVSGIIINTTNLNSLGGENIDHKSRSITFCQYYGHLEPDNFSLGRQSCGL